METATLWETGKGIVDYFPLTAHPDVLLPHTLIDSASSPLETPLKHVQFIPQSSAVMSEPSVAEERSRYRILARVCGLADSISRVSLSVSGWRGVQHGCVADLSMSKRKM